MGEPFSKNTEVLHVLLLPDTLRVCARGVPALVRPLVKLVCRVFKRFFGLSQS